jgi:hypothetical protein
VARITATSIVRFDAGAAIGPFRNTGKTRLTRHAKDYPREVTAAGRKSGHM